MSCYAVFRLSPNVRERLEHMSITFTEDSLVLRTNAGTRVLSYADIERIKVTEAPGSEVGVSSVSLFLYREKRVVLQGYEDMRVITSDLLQQTSAEVTKKNTSFDCCSDRSRLDRNARHAAHRCFRLWHGRVLPRLILLCGSFRCYSYSWRLFKFFLAACDVHLWF